MANIKKIKVGSTTYDIKDVVSTWGIGGTTTTLDHTLSAADVLAELGLTAAMHFIGAAESSTSTPSAGNYIKARINENSSNNFKIIRLTTSGTATEVAATLGDVFSDGTKEYVCTRAGKFNATVSSSNMFTLLGDEGSYALNSISVTGTGALGGGGTLTQSRTITHNAYTAQTLSGGTKKVVATLTSDGYGHITAATEKTIGDHSYTPAGTNASSSVTLSGGATKKLVTTSITGVSGSTTASKATSGTAVAVAKAGTAVVYGTADKASTATTVGNADVGEAVTVVTGASGTFVTSAINSAKLQYATSSGGTYQDIATGGQSVITALGSTQYNTDAIKSASLDVSDTTSSGDGRTPYISAVSGTFVTSAINGASTTLSSADSTSTGAITYNDGTFSTAASLGGTTTFNTNAIKSATSSLSSENATATGRVQYATGAFDTAASLGGTTTFATSGITATYNATDEALEFGTAGTGTVTFTAPVLTKKYMAVSTSTTAASTGTVTLTAPVLTKKYLTATTNTTAASTGSVSATTKYAKVTTAAASKSTPGGTTRYIKVTTGTAGTGSVSATTASITPAVASSTTIYGAVDAPSTQKITPAVSNGTITPYTFSDVTVPTAASSATTVATGKVATTDTNGDTVVTALHTGGTAAAQAFTGTAATIAHSLS